MSSTSALAAHARDLRRGPPARAALLPLYRLGRITTTPATLICMQALGLRNRVRKRDEVASHQVVPFDDLDQWKGKERNPPVYAYVINLARSLDRREHITAELKKTGLDYEIITAVDGRDLDLDDPAIVDPSFFTKVQLVAGTVGAALSHQSAYQKIIAAGLDKALVLEDDIELPADLENLADAVADQLVGAEVALLSYAGREPCRMSREGSIDLPSGRLLALPVDINESLASASAYVITREACERMSSTGKAHLTGCDVSCP
jgi:Glycosyltransferase family 25 (LPS biosynthesis protein)